jgi:GT2 family glycosyltransferase
MSICHESSSERHILAVIVLYQRAPSESQSLCCLIQILSANPDLAKYFSLILYDNSLERHDFEAAVDFPVFYRHDPTNAGLAAAFNFALAHAEVKHLEWLLLLDQDTSPTTDFFSELVACTNMLRGQQKVSSIVPKLLVSGKVYSPEAHFIDQIRHQYRRSGHAVTHEVVGVQQGRLNAYNSGATFRVSALRSIGGFPEEFWLDYLDHAVFHALAVRSDQMYVMRTEIEHEVSQASLSDVPVWRQRNILWAQTLFVKQNGNFVDRLLYRLWVLRYSRSLWIHYPDKRLWKEALLQAFLLKTPTERAPVNTDRNTTP